MAKKNAFKTLKHGEKFIEREKVKYFLPFTSFTSYGEILPIFALNM